LAVTVSNGLAFSPDGKTMYHADTKAHRISAYSFDLDAGQPEDARIFHQFDSTRGPGYEGRPDGAATDSDGDYWVAMYEGGCVLQLARTGEVLSRHLLPVRCPTMPAFGGEDMQTLFITSVSHGRTPEELAQFPDSGQVLAMPAPVKGKPEPLCRL
jgi:sugar lactone lactonase YvrE